MEDREDINDDIRPGRPRTSTIDENIKTVKKMAVDYLGITIRELAGEVDLLCASCQANFTDVLGMKREEVKVAQKLQNFEAKQHRMNIA